MQKKLAIVCCAALVFTSGCATHQEESKIQEYYKPINAIQREFYDVQTLFESKKYQDVVEAGQEFLAKYQRDILNVAVMYYVGVSYQKLGDYENSDSFLNNIQKMFPESDWGKLAVVSLAENKDFRGN